MKLEVDLDEAFDEYCKELSGRRWLKLEAKELAEKTDKILSCGDNYQVMAEALKIILDGNPTLKSYLDDLLEEARDAN